MCKRGRCRHGVRHSNDKKDTKMYNLQYIRSHVYFWVRRLPHQTTHKINRSRLIVVAAAQTCSFCLFVWLAVWLYDVSRVVAVVVLDFAIAVVVYAFLVKCLSIPLTVFSIGAHKSWQSETLCATAETVHNHKCMPRHNELYARVCLKKNIYSTLSIALVSIIIFFGLLNNGAHTTVASCM